MCKSSILKLKYFKQESYFVWFSCPDLSIVWFLISPGKLSFNLSNKGANKIKQNKPFIIK